MTTRTLAMVSAATEAMVGLVLIAAPELAARALLGAGLTPSGVAVARVAGFGLLALGLACWPSGETVSAPVTRGLFIYNLLAGFYLGYLRVGGGFVSYLLWPACILHVAIALLLLGPVFRKSSM